MDNNNFNSNYENERVAAEVRSTIITAFILGILGIVLSFTSGIIGVILAIISLVMVSKANNLLVQYPQVEYMVADDLGKLNTAKTLSIISFVIFGLLMLCSCGFGIFYGCALATTINY